MALIKCKHCGNMISDKAIRCPKCNQINDNIKEQGKVIQDSHKKDNEEEVIKKIALEQNKEISNIKNINYKNTQSNTEDLQQSVQTKAQSINENIQNASTSKSNIWIIATIIIVLIAIGGVFFFLKSSDEEKSLMEICEEIPVQSQTDDSYTNDNNAFSEDNNKYSTTESQRINNVSVIASSTIENQGNNSYHASNLLDGRLETSWATSYKDNEERLIFNTPICTIQKIIINNGYGKSEKSYKDNSRARNISIYINGEFIQNKILEDTWRPQTIILDTPYHDVQEIKITITDIYRGLKYNDLCISEISFWGSSTDLISNVVFKGNIDDKYPIVMPLQIEGSSVKGKYYYTKYDSSNSLKLVGTYSNKILNLNEYNSDNENTGVFNGRYEENIFSGIFINYKGKQMPFKLYLC